MINNVILDEATNVKVEVYKLIEQKRNHMEFDGHRETNRIYSYYFSCVVVGEDDELWDNPFALFDFIRVRRLIARDLKKNECVLFKLSSINKYQMDQAIDQLEMLVEGPGHYKLIKHNNYKFTLDDTTIFDFLNFFKWNQDVIE